MTGNDPYDLEINRIFTASSILSSYYGAVFRADPLFYDKFDNMGIFRSGDVYSGNRDYQKIIHF